MSMILKGWVSLLAGAIILTIPFSGCTPKPSSEEMGKLEEARAAAESAERKLSELRKERMRLEQELENAKAKEKDEQEESQE